MPGHEAVLTLYWPKNDDMSWMTSRVVFFKWQNLKSHSKSASRGDFFSKNLKNHVLSIFGQYNVKTALCSTLIPINF